MAFGYEFDKLINPLNVESDLRYALKKKDGMKSLCLQYTKNRLISDPSVAQFDSYINFQLWFKENGDIEVHFGDYNLTNSPVYVPNEGFYLQTVNAGPILSGPIFGLYHPYKENIIYGIDGPYDSLRVLQQDGALTVLPPSNWVIKFEKQTSSIYEIQETKSSISPNPVKDRLRFTTPIKNCLIYNLEGKVLRHINSFNDDIYEIDVSELTSGMYILRTNLNNSITLHKFIKI